MNIGHYTKFVPRSGLGLGQVRSGWIFSKIKDRFKPIKNGRGGGGQKVMENTKERKR